MSEELVLVEEATARRALRKYRLELRVLAPHGSWAGCGALRVLRLKLHPDSSAELMVGYESYRPI